MSGETSVLALEAEELRKKVPALEARIKELESFLGSLGFGNDAQAEASQLRNLLASQIAGRNEAETQLGERKAEIEQLKKERDEALAKKDYFLQDNQRLKGELERADTKCDQLEAKCAEMRELIEEWRDDRTVMVNRSAALDRKIAHALSSDCGKGWIKVGELIEVTAGCDDEAFRVRVAQLIERAKK